LENFNVLEAPRFEVHNTSVYAQYTILCDNRDSIQSKLKENDVPSVPYYSVPLHLQLVFKNLKHNEGNFLYPKRWPINA
jgi:UDP-2-acetamido-2-deoxy-ribo-hexuluronate aminotransferase